MKSREGMSVHYDDDVRHIPEGVDLVVFTPAVPKDHRELNWFLERGYPVKKRAEVLGIISQSKHCVAIAGTHGKTTTSSMLAYLLTEAGKGCTAFLGGITANYSSNFLLSNKPASESVMVVEADEFDRSLLEESHASYVCGVLAPLHLRTIPQPDPDLTNISFARVRNRDHSAATTQ